MKKLGVLASCLIIACQLHAFRPLICENPLTMEQRELFDRALRLISQTQSTSDPAQKIALCSQGLSLFRQATVEANEDAQTALSILSDLLLLVTIDKNDLECRAMVLSEVERCWRKIATEYNDKAYQLRLGNLFLQKSNAVTDETSKTALLKEAELWYSKAAAQGDSEAQSRLSFIRLTQSKSAPAV